MTTKTLHKYHIHNYTLATTHLLSYPVPSKTYKSLLYTLNLHADNNTIWTTRKPKGGIKI